jgi:hypothetical protein
MKFATFKTRIKKLDRNRDTKKRLKQREFIEVEEPLRECPSPKGPGPWPSSPPSYEAAA